MTLTPDPAAPTMSAVQQTLDDDRLPLDVAGLLAPALFTCVEEPGYRHSDGPAIVVHRKPCPGWYAGCRCTPIFVRHPVHEA